MRWWPIALLVGCAASSPHRTTMPLAQLDRDPWNQCQNQIRQIACGYDPSGNNAQDAECIQALHMQYAHAFDRLAWLEQYDCP